jgi:hypothetical protein
MQSTPDLGLTCLKDEPGGDPILQWGRIHGRIGMMKLKFAFAAAALAIVAAQPAEASYKVIKWDTGICQVWDNATPWNAGPGGWRTVSRDYKSFHRAMRKRHRLIVHGRCW